MLAWLEKRLGRWAIPGLVTHVVLLQGVVWVLLQSRMVAIEQFVLDRRAVAAGEVWRLVTHLLVLPPLHPVIVLIALYLLWTFGRALEAEWGTFRLNVYYLLGALAATLVALTSEPGVLAQAGHGGRGATYLNLSLFLAFATLYPDFPFLLFFVIPFKAKWLAWLSAAYLALDFVRGGWTVRGLILVSLANYLLFFWRPFLGRLQARVRRETWRARAAPPPGAFHRCAACGRTERDDPRLEFRVCTDCAGGREFCLEHLPGHTHVTSS